MSEPTNQSQPKITQKLLVRTVGLLFFLAILLAAFSWFKGLGGDYGQVGSSNTTGEIAAIEYTPNGSRAVVLKGDEVKKTSSWKDGVTDRDITWSADGSFVYFVSDREEGTFRVYRWNPDRADAESRTGDKRSRSMPTFPVGEDAAKSPNLLIISGGTVQELDPIKKQTPQVLPPVSAEIARTAGDDDAKGAEGQLAAVYGDYGTGFKKARWVAGKRFVAGLMNRDNGECLIIQDLEMKDGKYTPPMPVVAGDHISFDVSKDGKIFYSVQNWKWPSSKMIPRDAIKGGKILTPVRHMIGLVEPSKPGPVQVVIGSNDDKVSFGSLAISPDGAAIAVVVGPYGSEGAIEPQALVTMPATMGGGQRGTVVARGAIFEPAWNPQGALLAFVRRDKEGHRTIYTINKDGGGERSVTAGKGDFGYPTFSPQTK